MSKLETYQYPYDHLILSLEGEKLAVIMSPGELVRHANYTGTSGVLVATGDKIVTVLWSIPPGGMSDLTKSIAKQIQDEIDVEILRELGAK